MTFLMAVLLRLRCGAANSRIRLAGFSASAGLEFDHCQAAQTLPVHRKHRRVWRMVVLATTDAIDRCPARAAAESDFRHHAVVTMLSG
jgi:hypothetical protein